ncbi:DUF2635 domain-containing protein [Enterobacter mori]|uniref:DUF2635 domain-containing protein n=1 Tax=Enterobacter mori TaxID=539813 RepID=UPI003B840D72
MAKIKVKAAPGRQFPMERKPKRYIGDKAVEVESSAYYRRAVKDGDLILVTGSVQPAAKPVKANDKKEASSE